MNEYDSNRILDITKEIQYKLQQIRLMLIAILSTLVI